MTTTCALHNHILTSSQDVDVSRLGGKAANLRHLAAAGFPVPDWFVVSTDAFDTAMAAVRTQVNQLLDETNYTCADSIERTSQQIDCLILKLDLDAEFCAALQGSLAELGTHRVSVRSSVLGEDSAEHSFAGQMASFLHVPPTQVPATVKRVWASAYSARALTYRHHKALPSTSIRAAVIVQRMITSVTSGVLFSRDPETRERQSVICAGYGLGEGVVADRVETDTFRVAWDSGDTTHSLSTKTLRLDAASDGHSGVSEQQVAAHLRDVPVLSAQQISQLHDVGVQAETTFGLPQDLEWAFDEAGDLYLLQARPIVFAPSPKNAGPARIWDNSNVVESFPGLTLPLTFSFARQCYATAFRPALAGFLWQPKVAALDDHVFDGLIGLLDGRVYYNLHNWYTMYSYLPGFERRKQAFDQMIGVGEKLDVEAVDLSLGQRLGNVAKTAWRLLTVSRSNRDFQRSFDTAYAGVAEIDLAACNEVDLAVRYRDLERAFTPLWHLTLYNDFHAMTWLSWLQGLCRRWRLVDPSLPNDLLCGQGGIDSVEPLYALLEMASQFNSTPALRQLLDDNDDQSVWEQIQSDASFAGISRRLNAHLQAFGDRGPEDLKLEKPSLRQQPARLIGLIRSYAERGLQVDDLRQHELSRRQHAQALVATQLRNPLQRVLFHGAVQQARRGIASRENMRFARSRLYGLVRQLFARMGELFVERRLLADATDVFYLTVDEVLGTVEGTGSTGDLQGLVELRKADYVTFATRSPDERMWTTGIPGLDLSYSTTAAVAGTSQLQGTGCSAGAGRGQARIIAEPGTPLGPGAHVIVARSTDPGWVFLMIESQGIVVERGSLLSHTAIVGRELGIPTVVGVAGATEQIPEGAEIVLDGSTGVIQWN